PRDNLLADSLATDSLMTDSVVTDSLMTDSVVTDSTGTRHPVPDSLLRERTPLDSLGRQFHEPHPADSVTGEPVRRDSVPAQAYLLRAMRAEIHASTLYRPGPSNRMARNPVRNAGASSCLSNRFQSRIDITNNKVMINGKVASRVNKPTTTRAAQTSSAKIAIPMDSAPPRPNRS